MTRITSSKHETGGISEVAIKKATCSGAMILLMTLLLAVTAAAEEKGKLYVVGAGPAGSDLMAPRAQAAVKAADIYLTSPGLPDRFDRFEGIIDPEKVAFDPWEPFMGSEARQLKKDDPEAWEAHSKKHRHQIQRFIREQIDKGKTVAMIDGGDPCVYAPSLLRLLKGFDPELFEVIPGMGAFNAAGAALKTTFTPDDVRFVMLTSPRSLFGENWEKEDGILKDLSKYNATMIWYMSLRSIDQVVLRMKEHYPPHFPIAIVYYAGYADREKVLRSTLDSVSDDVKQMEEEWLGLFIAGEVAAGP